MIDLYVTAGAMLASLGHLATLKDAWRTRRPAAE